MKKTVLLSILILVFISSPLAAGAVKIAADETTGKRQKEQIDVHLELYGIRFVSEYGRQHSIGLYKIIIGDPEKLASAMSLNKSNGFDGLIFTTYQDKKDDWHRIRVHRPMKDKKGWKESSIVRKVMLPYPFNNMADDLLHKIQFFNVYPNNDDVSVVYIVEGTKFSDCKKIFDYISQKKKHPPNTAGI